MTPSVPRTPVLLDPDADERLASVGFAVIPLLEPEVIEHLTSAQRALEGPGGTGLQIDFMQEDRARMAGAAEVLGPMWAEHLPRAFTDHELVVSTFIVKHPGEASSMGMHNEPTYVTGDEPTYNIWVPLVDVSEAEDNGVLRLVLGSQDLPLGLTGYNTSALYRPYDDDLRRCSRGLDVPAGHGVVYDTRMLHWSDANRSERPRPAVAASVARRGTPLIHVLATGRRSREVYAVERDFFVRVHPSEVERILRDGHELLEVVADEAVLSPADLASLPDAGGRPGAPRTLLPWYEAGRAGAPELEATSLPEVAPPSADVGPPPAGSSRSADGAIEAGALGHGTVDGEAVAAPATSRGLPPPLISATDDAQATVFGLASRSHARFAAATPALLVGLDGPEVDAGLATAAGIGTVVPGRALPVSAGPVTVWNEGPGWAWFAVFDRSAPAPPAPEPEPATATATATATSTPPPPGRRGLRRAWAEARRRRRS